MIEEDPDTVLDVLHLLDHATLPRARSRQMPTRTGTDRLQLSGAVVLADGCYAFINESLPPWAGGPFHDRPRRATSCALPGRWSEAIAYLAPQRQLANVLGPPAVARGNRPVDLCLRLGRPGLCVAGGRAAARVRPVRDRHLPRPPGRGPARSRLSGRKAAGRSSTSICATRVASRRRRSTWATTRCAGTADEARLVVSLASPNRPLGVVTVERYVENRDPHELPEELPDLLRFLQHAAGALENVITRAAYRTIGQAVLDAKAMQPTVERVLEHGGRGLGLRLWRACT